jgi:hypothetical protein
MLIADQQNNTGRSNEITITVSLYVAASEELRFGSAKKPVQDL